MRHWQPVFRTQKTAFRISRGLWSLGRPRRFGVGRSGWRSGHSASDRSPGYLLLSITQSLASSLRLFQTVSERLSEKSRTRLQSTLSVTRKGTFSAHFGLRILAKSMVEGLLEPLFGRSRTDYSRKPSFLYTGVLGNSVSGKRSSRKLALSCVALYVLRGR